MFMLLPANFESNKPHNTGIEWDFFQTQHTLELKKL